MTSTARRVWPQWWPAGLAWALAGLTVLALVPAFRLAELIRPTSLATSSGPASRPSWYAAIGAVVLATVSAAAVGALLASRRPRHPVGWLLLGVGLGLAMNNLIEPT